MDKVFTDLLTVSGLSMPLKTIANRPAVFVLSGKFTDRNFYSGGGNWEPEDIAAERILHCIRVVY